MISHQHFLLNNNSQTIKSQHIKWGRDFNKLNQIAWGIHFIRTDQAGVDRSRETVKGKKR
jgi:hypothetical protein